jgi:DNA-binding LacI/PurR family transcriptional regulator
MLLEQRVGGIILVPALSVSESVAFIQKLETPIVVLDRKEKGIETDSGRFNSELGVYQLTQLLLSLGHR